VWLGLATVPALAEAPLSAIDWLKQPAPVSVAQPLVTPLAEPPVAHGATVPEVAVMSLGDTSADAVGLLPSGTTGLPRGLWAASATDTLVAQIARIDETPLPAVQALYYTLLLAEADPPEDAADNALFLRARIAALRRFGAVEPALALIERAGPATPALFDEWLELALLTGRADAPCAALARAPLLTADHAARVYCLARAGDWATAALTYEAAVALDTLSAQEADLLEGYLDPELAGGLADLPPPPEMTPLLFRLYEAGGMPLPTRTLPRAYAVADLRGTMGWKSAIEAAERLARAGALPANQLLGLYTERRPAASGGVWDRVRAVQRLDAAVAQDDTAGIARHLPPAWQMMRENGLGVVFATLYGPDLIGRDLGPEVARLAYEVALLSPEYESARPPGTQTRRLRFLAGLAGGAPDPALARGPTEEAIATAFAATRPPADHAGPLAQGRLGQTLLTVAGHLQGAGPRDNRRLTASLATLRMAGLEGVARQAALQILLLQSPR